MTKAMEVMTSELHVIQPDETIQSAARLMKHHDIGVLPVISAEGQAVGTITDRDIAVRAVATSVSPNEMKVKDAMTPNVEFCYDDDSLETLARDMGDKQLHRLLVVDRKSRGIKGIVTLGDIASRSEDKKVAGNALAACVAS